MIELHIVHAAGEQTFTVARGTILRDFLLAHDLTPYTWVTKQLNCGGRGICATCGVVVEEQPAPTHWHDKLAQRFRYPRLSCQIAVDEPLTVRILPDKIIWGKRLPRELS